MDLGYSNNGVLLVTKSSGEQAPFSKKKLRRSLERSGAGEKDIYRILIEIDKILYPGISTKKIYKKAFSLLKKTENSTAARYKLKKAIMELGPSGFPFERYVAEVFKSDGYQVKVSQFLDGLCLKHEVDIVAENNEEHLLIECKFHAESNRICDVKVPLYLDSRFKDIKNFQKQFQTENSKTSKGYIVNNTRFSEDAMRYGNCAGLFLLGWNFPERGSLKERVDNAGIYPVTCLTTITKQEKQSLLKREIVLCKDLFNHKKILRNIGIKDARMKRVFNEVSKLCNLKITA